MGPVKRKVPGTPKLSIHQTCSKSMSEFPFVDEEHDDEWEEGHKPHSQEVDYYTTSTSYPFVDEEHED